ncbi:MAG: AAA domain-containing protein, partial [Candidatus Bathyarchaeia archaeon]
MVRGLATSNAPTTQKEKETKTTPSSPETQNPNLELIEKLISILNEEKKSQIYQSTENQSSLGKILNISENVATIKYARSAQFDVGEDVRCIKGETVVDGQISDATHNFLWVSFKENHNLSENDEIKIIKIESAASYDLQLDLLENIKKGKIPHTKPPVEFFVSTKKLDALPDDAYRNKLSDCKDVADDKNLDDYQTKAVENAISLKEGEFLLIIGPPGTGKTKVIRKIAYELMNRGNRVLITSHTNLAVDNALQGLPVSDTLRIGKPHKVNTLSRDYLLSSRAENSEGKLFKEINRELEQKIKRRRELQNNSQNKTQQSRIELADLNKQIKELEAKRNSIVKDKRRELLEKTPIIGSTIIASCLSPMAEVKFDTVIIDECSQASIPLALLAMLKGKKWILVGDHKQLLPIFKSLPNEEQRKLLEDLSAFNHLIKKYNQRSTWLKFAYRSNPEIVEFPAKYVYEEKIEPYNKDECAKIKLRLKKQLSAADKMSTIIDPDKPVVFVHVDGKEEEVGSKLNETEVEVCSEIVKMLREHGIERKQIGIIAPYQKQVKRLKSKINDGAEVSTVDSFQGKEKDIIIFSVTATNKYSLEFVSNVNR